MKITLIGGGSTYTPELIDGVIQYSKELPVDELVLMDIDGQRLRIVGGLADRMLQAAGVDTQLRLTLDREEALHHADYVIVQLRVGGMAARILDERIPLKFGVIGQETIGPGGFACALRTIPVVVAIARDMEKLAPYAWLINFTNPSGLVTEAILKSSRIKAVGLCNVPVNFLREIANLLSAPLESITLDYVGLNHLSWIRGVTQDGQDVFHRVFSSYLERATRGEWPFDPELLKALGVIPSYYLRYYYHPDRVLVEITQAGRTRAEEVMEVEAALLQIYSDPRVHTKPKLLEKRGGALYSQAALSLISALYHSKGEVHILNVRNGGALPDVSPECVVEIPTVVDKSGPRPIPTAPLPPGLRGLVHAVKAYEELTLKAALEGDEKAALQALLAHPLVPSFSVAQALWPDVKDANRQFLPPLEGAMGHVLGVDAGGSKTLAAVADETGRVLAIGRAGGANHQIIGIEAALREIKKACQEAIERSSLTAPLDFAVLGVAGADLPQDFELLASALMDLGLARRIRVENDTFIALRAGAQKGWGVVVVCGAGCNAAGLAPDGRSFRLPGLGWISGDWGGGGSIAQEAVRLAARAWDGRGEPTLFQNSSPKHLVCNPWRE